MSSSTSQELHDGNRCWICLGEGDEVPPMGTPQDASDWIKPCSCSLIAHKKCLINWILSIDLDKRRALLRDGENAVPQPQNISVNVFDRIGINIRTESISQRFLPPFLDSTDLTLCVKCPQCSNPLFLKNHEDKFNSFVQYIQSFLTSGTRFMFYSTLISTSIASTIASICATLSGMGIQILTTICPDSVLMKLLNIPAKGLVDALNKNLLTGRFFSITTLLPIYLSLLRKSPFKTSNVQEALIQMFPLFFLQRVGDLNSQPRARQGICILNLSRYVYNLLFSLTFNRVYYKWVRSSQPSFIADRLSLKELDMIQRENEEEYEIQQEDELANKNIQSIWQRIMHYFSLNSKLKSVKRSRHRRELENCLKYDYSSVFNKSSGFFTILSTIMWPMLGERVSTVLLSRSKVLLQFLNRFAKTPDEATFFRNLIGCCCIVLLKDVVNLYLSWKKVKQLNNMKVVEFGTDEWTRDSIASIAAMGDSAAV